MNINVKFYRSICWNVLHIESGCGLGLGELPKILGYPYNISAMAEASNFCIGTRLGFAKALHKIPHQGKVDVALG